MGYLPLDAIMALCKLRFSLVACQFVSYGIKCVNIWLVV